MSKWKMRDAIVMVVLAIVTGALYRVWDVLYPLIPTVWVPAQAATNGLWMIASILVMYIVRRPGAALLAELIAASIELILGSQWGLSNMTAGLIQGLGAEIAFAIFAYRRYNVGVCWLAGALASFAAVIQWYVQYGGDKMTTASVIGYLVVSLISGAILGGWLPKSVGDALKRTGVLRNFAIGKEAGVASR